MSSEQIRPRLTPEEYEAVIAFRCGDIPQNMNVKGTTTLYGADGEQRLQWVKESNDSNTDLMTSVVDAMCEKVNKETVSKRTTVNVNDDLANVYVLTDFHLGMLSWSEETGDDWDTGIAEDLLVRWFERAISMSPDAEVGIFAQMGDFLHFDSLQAITPSSGNILDADTRFQLLVRVVIRVLRRVTRMLLEKHEHVHLIMAEGNHDMAGSAWLRELMDALYEDDQRITVDTNPDIYYCYEHGYTSIFFHHGHKKAPGKGLDSVLAAKYREVFGRTKFSYAHTGHYHHDNRIESNLMICEQHRTLAGADAYASRGGWMSGRDAKVITYSKKHGEVGRITISPDMVSNVK